MAVITYFWDPGGRCSGNPRLDARAPHGALADLVGFEVWSLNFCQPLKNGYIRIPARGPFQGAHGLD